MEKNELGFSECNKKIITLFDFIPEFSDNFFYFCDFPIMQYVYRLSIYSSVFTALITVQNSIIGNLEIILKNQALM